MSTVLKAYKCNRVVRIPAEKKNEYLQNGYTIKDMSGHVIAEPNTDKNLIHKLQQENERLQKKNELLERENAELKAKLAPSTEEEPAKPTTGRGKK